MQKKSHKPWINQQPYSLSYILPESAHCLMFFKSDHLLPHCMLSSDATTSRSRERRTSWIIYKGRRLGSRTRVTDDHHASLSNWFDWSTELERMRGQTEFTETEIKSSTWTLIHHLDLHFWLRVRGPRSRNWKCHLGEDGCLNVLVHRPNNLQKRNVREFCFDINLSSNTIPASKSNLSSIFAFA